MPVCRYLHIVRHLLKTSIAAQAQYRVDFIIQMILAMFWAAWHIAPLWIVFDLRESVAGWSRPEAMLVMSAFLILKAMLEGLITPNLTNLVEGIRSGSLDFVLLKPADAQLLVSFARIQPAKVVDLLAGLAVGVWSIAQLDPIPSLDQIAAGVLMLFAGALSIYAVWLAVICSAFWWVKVDNLAFLFTSIFDAARWPISVFRGWVRIVLTYVLPIALMTSYPALAILNKLSWSTGVYAWLMTIGLLVGSRWVWRRALATYASASS